MTRNILAVAALAAAVQFTPNHVAAQATDVEVRVNCVLASNTDQEFDERLAPQRPRFYKMFRYTSYRLVKEKRERVAIGSKMGFDVPGGRYLLVIPKEFREDGSIALKVMLLEGSRPIVDTQVSVHGMGTFVVAGPQYQEGSLILSIGASRGVTAVNAGIPAEAAPAQ